MYSLQTPATRKLYGLDEKVTAEFGLRCLFARRMVERGVRFVQLYCGDTNGWDGHSDVNGNHTKLCAQSDLPVAGLLKDLKRRGFRFVGPTTAYALMQATGMVDDHTADCWVPAVKAAS